jgi:hypothetical protein
MNIDRAIRHLYPNAEWSIYNDTYEGLTWMSNTPKPTLEELQNAWNEIKNEVIWEPIRMIRDDKLKETDWIITKHFELGTPIPENWKNYRQALRDLPQTFGSPDEVVWPTKP